MFATVGLALLCTASGAALALPKSVPLRSDKGFWFGDVSVGPQNFTLSIGTGGFAVIIGEGLYNPNPTSVQTNMGEFNGASQDDTAFETEVFYFVQDLGEFSNVTLDDLLVGNMTQGDPLPGNDPPAFMVTDPNDPTFLAGQSLTQAICDQENISPCEFGLALKRDGTGSLIFGELQESNIIGDATTLKTLSSDTWWVVNDTEASSPIFVVDGKPITHIQPIFDGGTPNIIGPLAVVRAVLLSVGYDVTEQTDSDNITTVFRTYDCSRAPARFGFSFPPSEQVHYIDLAANVLNKTADGRVCTANILGTTIVDQPEWLIGQTWFQGRYVQHDLFASTISFADLKHP